MLLFYGLATVALAISIGGDAFDKILLIQVAQEKSSAGAIPQASFIYKTFEKYHGEIEYKIVNPVSTTLFVVTNTTTRSVQSNYILDFNFAIHINMDWNCSAFILLL